MRDRRPSSYTRSCTMSRLRRSGLRLNARTASASAASRLGASTSHGLAPKMEPRFGGSGAKLGRKRYSGIVPTIKHDSQANCAASLRVVTPPSPMHEPQGSPEHHDKHGRHGHSDRNIKQGIAHESPPLARAGKCPSRSEATCRRLRFSATAASQHGLGDRSVTGR